MYGHVLQCVGECCDNELTGLRPHEDEDKDRKCDICDYNITGILVTKQPSLSLPAQIHRREDRAGKGLFW